MAVRISRSIRAKIFGAFIAMSAVTGALGVFGLVVLSASGEFVVNTYDGPLMAINYARSASLDFAEMDKELLRRSLVPESRRDEIERRFDHLTTTFFEDLAVAEERSLAGDERAVIGEIRRLVAQWGDLRHTGRGDAVARELDDLAEKVIERFDALIELTVDHSFVSRRKALTVVGDFRTMSLVAIGLALLLSGAVTLLLGRRIVTPLSAAVTVADRIAGGELETPIPTGGADETGALLRSMAVMQDNVRVMMEREKAQRRSAQNRLVAALESTNEAIVLVDADGRVVIANSQLTVFFPPLARQLGSGENFAAVFREVAERLVTRIVVPGDGREPDWSELLASGGEFQLTDGRWLHASRSSTQDGGFFLVLSDFTEIKEREQRLNEARQQAEAGSAAKSAFLANMSHELRTPLNAIIGFAEILSGQVMGPIGNPKYIEYAGNILHGGRHLLDVISGVLDLAKSQAGQLRLNAETVELGAIFDDSVALMQDQCTRAQLGLVVKKPDRPLPVWADPAKLRQITLNLLSNAVKFTEPGGTVSMSAGPTAGGMVRVRVADTGIGMSQEHIAIALTPFSQVDSRLARRYEGSGLGLPLTKALIELHGGEMTISSQLGEGTEVSFTLPQSSRQDPPLRQDVSSAAVARQAG